MRLTRNSCWASFWPKVTISGRDDAEELGDDGEHAVEVAGAGASLEGAPHCARGDDGLRGAGRVHLLDSGREDDVNTLRGQAFDVGLQRAGVPLEVLGLGELGGVDEDGDDPGVGDLGSTTHVRDVAVVQGAKGGRESDRAARGALGGDGLAHGRNGVDHARRWCSHSAIVLGAVSICRFAATRPAG